MAAVAPAPARARPRREAAPRPARRTRRTARPRVAGGVLWIVLVAGLLAGIVAVNVAALRLNLESQRLDARKEKLVAENAAAASELSSLASSARIEQEALRLGLVRPSETRYVRARGGR